MSTSMEQKIEGKEHFHGSDLEKIEKYFGIPKEKITGFGANVNPLGISLKMKECVIVGNGRLLCFFYDGCVKKVDIAYLTMGNKMPEETKA